jgi:hypothetical protein
MAARPDWIVQVSKKEGDDRTIVGAAWNTEHGGISIRLNPCVILTDRDDVWILLKPNAFKDEEKHPPRRKKDE